MAFCSIRNSRARTCVLTPTLISSAHSTETARSPAATNLTMLERGEGRVRQVGDEHVAGTVRDHERRLAGERDRLRRYPARPEHGHVARLERLRVAPVRPGDVLDAER